MTRGSELLLYLLLGIPVAFVLLFLFALGPLGWFAVGFLGLGGMILVAYLDGGTADPAAETTNCATCGVPNDADRDTCSYCGDPL